MQGLSVWVTDPDDRIIDEYDNPDVQPDNTKMDPEWQKTFAKRRSLQEEAELKKKAAQVADAEKKVAQVAKKAEEEAALVAKRAKEERTARLAKDAEAQTTPGPQDAAASTQNQEAEENIPLRQLKRKAVADPANCIVVVGSSEIRPSSSQPITSTRARSAFGFPITRSNIFKAGPLGEGAPTLWKHPHST